MRDSLLFLRRALLECEQTALDEIKFLERKPPPRRAQLLLPFGKVNMVKRSRTPDEAILLANALRQRL